MNRSMVRYLSGWVLCLEAGLLLAPYMVSLYYHEHENGKYFLIMASVALLIGILCIIKKPKNKTMFAKEGFVTVALSWILLSVVGAFPAYLSGQIPSFIDSLFECISGFTTTGASILPEVESLDKCILFWRSFTHWIGGMGVLVFIMAIIPLAGGHQNMYLMRAESPGPVVSKLVPKLKNTAVFLYAIYIFMTVAEFVLLILGDMPIFDAACISFGTAGTGGLAVTNAGIASYTSPYLQMVIAVFMVLFGINFNMYFLILVKKFRQAFTLEEVRWYIGIVLTSTALIAWNIHHMYVSVSDALRDSFFQVSSIISTTGFSTADFDKWPQFSKMILLLLMFTGGCAGSTCGGIKVSRIILMFKEAAKEMFILIHPRNVSVVKMDRKRVKPEIIRSVSNYFMIYTAIFTVSLLIISFDNFDFTTNFSAIAATINNIGPGFSMVGPTCNFASFSVTSKVVMMLDMLIGRLELFPILMLFFPAVWKK